MSSTIPPIGTKGRYSLTNPWTTDPGTIYICSAIRYFVDIENLGIDVYENYYAPMDLDKSIFEEDRKNDVAIVTLTSETTAPIYVPSSYIAAYPDLSHRNYHHVVLSASLGPLPDYIDLTFLQNQVAIVVSDTIGLEPTVQLSVAPMTDTVTPEQHDLLEIAREAAIENRTTAHAKVLELSQTKSQLEQRLAIMEQILRDNNLIPE